MKNALAIRLVLDINLYEIKICNFKKPTEQKKINMDTKNAG